MRGQAHTNEIHTRLSARVTDAVFAVNAKITRFRERLPVLWQQAKTYFRHAHERSAKLTASAADKRRILQARVQSRLPVVLEQAKAHLREAHEHCAKLAASAADKRRILQARVQSRLPVVLEQAEAHLREAHEHCAKLAASVTDRQRQLREALRLKEHNLHALFADALGRGPEASPGIRRYNTRFPVVLKQAKVRLRQAENKVIRLARNVVDKPRKLRPRENDLQKLLASSQDAVVVTSVDHRFVAANPKALSLFGISERNMKMFTIDAFLSRGQIPLFDEIGASFASGRERCGECEIRRLDGNSGIAEYTFVANYVPFLHVCRFHNYRKWTIRRRLAAS